MDWMTDPFPHAIIDGLWDDTELEAAAGEFPIPADARWRTYSDPREFGKRAAGIEAWGPATRAFFNNAATPEFGGWLTSLTGIPELYSDEVGGGMHETGEGGRLGLHVDFNYHPATGWPRRLNLLTFLNREWECEWGGCLYLGENREVEVLPLFNRTVIFECTDQSWHGHPDPVVGDHLRRSLAAYYYTQPGTVEHGPARDTVYR